MQQPLPSNFEKIYASLSSKTLALALFGILIVTLIPKTLVQKNIFILELSYKVIILLIGINLLFCTIRRFSKLKKPTLIIHIGILIILIGNVLGFFGYVATVNVYEGSSTASFFRWDTERDEPLGFELLVNAINKQFYPTKVKVGVLNGVDKVGLFIHKTGESFPLDDYRVQIDSIHLEPDSLTLSIYDENNTKIGNYVTDSGINDLPQNFPFTFKLVAFQTPTLQRVWADITLLKDNKAVAKGQSEVNHPFIWQGLRIYNTQIAYDNSNKPYAGIQIVKDPGIPVVYAGFFIFTIGCLLWLPVTFKRGRK